MNVFRICIPLILIAALGPLTAVSSAQTPPGGRIMTVTRQVAEFSQREGALADAMRKADRAATDRLLAPDFELRDSSTASQPMPRAQWIAAKHIDDASEQMAVHDYGTVATVSYLVRASRPSRAMFVVDVWQKQGEDWKLAVRYQSQLPAGRMRSGDTPPTGRN